MAKLVAAKWWYNISYRNAVQGDAHKYLCENLRVLRAKKPPPTPI